MRATLAAIVALACAGAAAAAWQPTGSGGAAARATSLGGASAPTVTASLLSSSVAVSWPAVPLAGATAPAYVVRRYNLTGARQTVGGSCAGLVASTSCTETGVPLGVWTYTVTAAAGLWRGAESGPSAAVTLS